MQYKIEVFKNNKMIYEKLSKAEKPRQVVRKFVEGIQIHKKEYFDALITNELGHVWLFNFSIDFADNKKKVDMAAVSKSAITKLEVRRIFAGNIKISQVV